MKGSKFSIPSGNGPLLKSSNTSRTANSAAVPKAYAAQQRAVSHATSRAIHVKPKRCK